MKGYGYADSDWSENSSMPEQSLKAKRIRLSDHELEELREHIDLISFNISKVYRHAKDRSRKEFKKVKHTYRKKLHHFE